MLALFLGLVGSSVGAAVWAGVSRSAKESFGLLVLSLVGLWAGYLATMVVVVRRRSDVRFTEATGLRVAGPGDVGLGLLAGLGSSLVMIPIVYAVLLGLHVIHQHQLDKLADPAERLSNLASGPTFAVLFVLIGVGAPIVEELFFRGFLQPAVIRRLGPAGGIAITAVVFGAAHFEPLQFPALAAFGGVLGYLAWRTGRLGPGIVAHMAFNALTLVRLAH